jgi:hypothetical protein
MQSSTKVVNAQFMNAPTDRTNFKLKKITKQSMGALKKFS